MAEELSYILITPYTIAKSRTGGVLSRLLSRIDLELVGTQIFAPTQELAEAYAAALYKQAVATSSSSARLLSDFVLKTFAPTNGRRHRVMMLLFRGDDACKKLSDIAGALYPENRSIESINGETIRDTYADLVIDSEGKILYFEPAVMTPRSQRTAAENMKIFAPFLSIEPNIVENIAYPANAEIERTLVIIKPDNWKYASSRPGTIIDMFSRTGLRLIGCKKYQMTVSEALEFYGPVKDALIGKLGPMFGSRAKVVLEKEFGLPLSIEMDKHLTDSFGREYAVDQFNKIIEFMSGTRPDKCPDEELDSPGKVKCMVLIYEGVDAVNKIRDVLGPTDPTKAPGGTIRREFGHDVMVNTAHASDSPENAEREMGIVRIQNNRCGMIMTDYIKDK
ncbi:MULTISPECIES: nucleoside-diphosphate kinase [unclassified Oceanispirochaeta]|uniref:nucleoside-diphosphate kinase n=1 Tax=unclassified Oceanispirochaeta TaxID=2635722 RepID=UPI000E08E11F|nr:MULTISPECIES: nucleoside-diphosphate kinase [unclassified Oceanispirochaeta]MBF9018435.1 nucleoside-diphosphate kinase [Oceanispirochaeta sp. M2]NPD74866.1 nucleoside-diphosphate kinase [Oceanispirochaeta sp. M1]RDG29307.1 nucleoside-diphosphate kinase [Oceanispirochaeta sp. M1]